MDGMLSQDEINALLSGMSVDGDSGGSNSTGGSDGTADSAPEAAVVTNTDSNGKPIDESLLSDTERDAIGEIANISMGSSATTLYSLVNCKVNITTPKVSLANWDAMTQDYERPCVFIQIRYTEGLQGSDILIMRENDVKIITDLMMGGDGTNTEGELGELHLSAISEAMNQMMGSSATSLSSMLGTMIDISPPEANKVDLTGFKKPGEIADFLEDTFCKVEFRLQIGELVDSTILQLYPIDFAKSLYTTFLGQQMGGGSSEPEPAIAAAPEPAPYNPPPAQQQPDMSQMGAQPQMNMGMGMPQMGQPQMNMGMGQPQMGQPQMNMGMGMPQMGQPQMNMGQMNMGMGMPQMSQPQMDASQMPNIQPAMFQSFDGNMSATSAPENIGLIMDVPLEVTVELGRTTKSISEILDFAPGTIIELDKIAGEPIDVLVNGKFVAKGEVVVIEESFGVRVTEIIK